MPAALAATEMSDRSAQAAVRAPDYGQSPPSGCFGEPSDVPCQRIDFQIDRIPNLNVTPSGDFFGMRDEIDSEIGPLNLVYRQRRSVQRN